MTTWLKELPRGARKKAQAALNRKTHAYLAWCDGLISRTMARLIIDVCNREIAELAEAKRIGGAA